MVLKSTSFWMPGLALIASSIVACSSSTSPVASDDAGNPGDATVVADAATGTDSSTSVTPDSATDAPVTTETDAQADVVTTADSGLDATGD
jgi:hypothetical protein